MKTYALYPDWENTRFAEDDPDFVFRKVYELNKLIGEKQPGTRKMLRIPDYYDLGWDHVNKHLDLIREEQGELVTACTMGDTAAIADACGDLIVVVMGLMADLGLPYSAIMNQINQANLTKVKDGVVDENNKLQKPDGFETPDIEALLEFLVWKSHAQRYAIDKVKENNQRERDVADNDPVPDTKDDPNEIIL